MEYGHSDLRPENFKEDWEGQYSILPWMAYIASIPHIIFIITTKKENGVPNAGLEGWSSFTGEGDNFFAIVSGVLKSSHTYSNIIRDKEFCINFLSPNYLENYKRSISDNKETTNEISNSGLTEEEAKTIAVPRIKESFLKLECTLEWTKELVANGMNTTLCGRIKYISADSTFCTSNVFDRYSLDIFTLHLMAMKNPYTGERIRGGIGKVEVIQETEL